MIKKLLITVFLVLIQTGVFGATITSTTTGGDWSAASIWTAISRTGTITTTSGSINVTGTGTSFLTELAVGSILKTTGGVVIGTVATITSNTALTLVANATSTYTGIAFTAQVVPTESDDAVISTTGTNSVVITSDATAKSISVFGILTINNGITLTVYGNVDVNSGAKFNAGTGNNDSATIKVYGNFTNNGTANFWKSTVVIAGDLVTVSTILQNNGDILVGGDVSAVISGGGNGFVYPVNPNATVSVTGTSNAQLAGTKPADSTLLSLMNEVIYGGTCTFSLTTPSDVAMCSGAPAVSFTVAVSPISSPSFIWQVNTGGAWVDASDSTYYSGYQTNTLMVSNVTSSFNNYKYRVKVKQGTCTKNSDYAVLTVKAAPATPTIIAGGSTTFCAGASVTLTSSAGTTYLWSTGATTQSISPTTSGSYTVKVTNATGCQSASSLATIVTVNALPASPTISAGSSTTFCTGGSVTLTSSAGTSYLWSTGATTASIIPTTSGSYTVSVTNAAGCQSASSTAVVITVNALPNVPSVGAITHPTCALPTGSVVLSGLAVGGILNPGNISYSGTSTTISGLAVGTYSFTVTNASGCTSPASANVVINAFIPVENKWTAGAWALGIPTAEQKIVFDGGTNVYIFNSDIVACSCQAKSDVTIKSGHTLTLTNKLEVVGLADVVFEDGASLVQTNNVTTNSNTGNIEYNRITKSRNSDYTYWSSPVYSLQPLGGVAGVFPKSRTGTFYSFDSSINPADWKSESSGASMTVGKGYIARGPETLLGTQTPPDTQFTTTFNGVPNNGTINVSILHSGASDGTSNLIGNPYPSAINADLFLAANSSVIDGTIYFWTHNTEIGAGTIELGSGLYPYTGDDYASYNGTGGAAGSGGKVPTGKIASGQGFFVTSKLANGTAAFTNDMRLAGTTLTDGKGVNQQFFKTKNPTAKSAKTIEKNRIWLNLTNTQGAFKQTLVGYVTDATNDYDDRFDGESYDGNEFVDFYSVNQEKNLVIQGRALPFDENDEVPLGFRTTINGAFTINIDQVDGLLTNQAVFIEDKLTNTVFDLKSGNYTFNTVAGTFDDRFVLKYTNKTLGTKTFDSLEKTVLVSNKNKQIKIDSALEMIDKVTVFDLLGRQIYQKANVNSNELSISNLVSNRQVLMVKTTLQNGKTVTKKIIY